ncbi:hypothetical protein VK86_06010 [Moellerella wisconsensis]|nr:hypothetical protein VK86_06010 [Moellerella wisconsensis]
MTQNYCIKNHYAINSRAHSQFIYGVLKSQRINLFVTMITIYSYFIFILGLLMKKVFIALFALCALASIGGTMLAGMNIYTRSTTPIEQQPSQAEQPSILPAPNQH